MMVAIRYYLCRLHNAQYYLYRSTIWWFRQIL